MDLVDVSGYTQEQLFQAYLHGLDQFSLISGRTQKFFESILTKDLVDHIMEMSGPIVYEDDRGMWKKNVEEKRKKEGIFTKKEGEIEMQNLYLTFSLKGDDSRMGGYRVLRRVIGPGKRVECGFDSFRAVRAEVWVYMYRSLPGLFMRLIDNGPSGPVYDARKYIQIGAFFK